MLVQALGFWLGGQARHREQPAILVGRWRIEVHKGVPGQVTIELRQSRRSAARAMDQ